MEQNNNWSINLLYTSRVYYLRLASAGFCFFLALLLHLLVVRTIINLPLLLCVLVRDVIFFRTRITFGFLWFWFTLVLTRRILSRLSYSRLFVIWWSIPLFFRFLRFLVGTRILLCFSRSRSILLIPIFLNFLFFLTRRWIFPRSFWFLYFLFYVFLRALSRIIFDNFAFSTVLSVFAAIVRWGIYLRITKIMVI